jgi:RNA polymerase sigma factor (sigma-70 family)
LDKLIAVNGNKDIDLLHKLAQRDSSAIEQIYREYYPVIRHMVIQHQGMEEDVADVFQEAMYILYQKSTDPDFALTCQIKTYLYAICKNIWLKTLTKKRGSPIQYIENEQDIQYWDDAEEHFERQRQFDQMSKAMDQLGEPCKSLIESFYIHKKPMHEIAITFNYTNADNAKNQKYKCLMRLKKLFFSGTDK